MEKYGTSIANLTLQPSGGGVYEVSLNDSLIFSKKKLDRFPDDGEIITLVENN